MNSDKESSAKKLFSINIQKLRKERGLTQLDLALGLNLSKATVSEWESAKKLPNAGNIEKIANFFNVPKSVLLREEDSYTTLEPMVNLPIVGHVSCGNGVIALEDIEGYEPTPKSWLNGGEYIYTRVEGDSMVNARICDGDLVLIRRQPDVENGEIAAINKNGKIFLKRIYKQDGQVILQSENPKYPPIIFNPNKSDCFIVGKLKRIIIRL
jgi:repressor LexA